MQNSRFGIFSNDKLFLAFSVIDVVIGVFVGVLCFIEKNIDLAVVPFIAVLSLCLFLSYRDHQKNVMKGLMGASLMWLFIEGFDSIKALMALELYGGSADDGSYRTRLGIKIVTMVLVFAVFVFHFLINSEHHSSPFEVGANKFLCIAVVAAYVADIFFNGEIGLIAVCYRLFKIFLILMIVCVEAKLDLFRVKREENGWTED